MGDEEQRMAFDPWGMRTDTGDTTDVNALTNKGYTGHEMDDEVGLINMNARIYDPYLGRFLSADPLLPDASDMQAFNRYSYVLGNPLKYVDPTGNMGIDVTITIETRPEPRDFLFDIIWGSERAIAVADWKRDFGGGSETENMGPSEDSGFDEAAIEVILEGRSPVDSDPGDPNDDRTEQERRIDDIIAEGQGSCITGGGSGTVAGVPVLYVDPTSSFFPGQDGGAFLPWFELFGNKEKTDRTPSLVY